MQSGGHLGGGPVGVDVDAAAYFNSSSVGVGGLDSGPRPNISHETYASAAGALASLGGAGGALASLGGAGGALASVVDVSLSGSESEPSSEA